MAIGIGLGMMAMNPLMMGPALGMGLGFGMGGCCQDILGPTGRGALGGGLIGTLAGGLLSGGNPLGFLAGGAAGSLIGGILGHRHEHCHRHHHHCHQFPPPCGGGYGGYGGGGYGCGFPGGGYGGGFPGGGYGGGFPGAGYGGGGAYGAGYQAGYGAGQYNAGYQAGYQAGSGGGFPGYGSYGGQWGQPGGCFPPYGGGYNGGCCPPNRCMPGGGWGQCGSGNPGGQLDQCKEGGPINYRTSGGWNVRVDHDKVIITDPTGKQKVEHSGDPHEYVNGKHVKDWEGKARSIVLPDGTKITMGASGPQGVVTSTSIYDGDQNVQINNGNNQITHHSYNPYDTRSREAWQADGETAAFRTNWNGSKMTYDNLYTQDENFGIRNNYKHIAGSKGPWWDRPFFGLFGGPRVHDAYNDPRYLFT